MTLFLDTTIQVDRILENDAGRKSAIDALIQDEFLLCCSFSRLEFKRIVIQNLALVLNYLIDEKFFFGALARARRLRQERRVKTLVSIVVWLGQNIDREIEVSIGDSVDAQLRLRAESFIRNAIEYLWHWFNTSVGEITDKTQCQRATESPERKRSGNMDVSIHESDCRNRKCRNALFIQENAGQVRRLCDKLADQAEITDELKNAIEALRNSIGHWHRLYDYRKCLAVGDVWIHLECLKSGVTELATTNYKESEHLCPALGLTMRKPQCPL